MEKLQSWFKRDSEWLIIALYPLLFVVAQSFSVPYWNLDAGVRAAGLWTVPVRHWWILAVLEWIARATLTVFHGAAEFSILGAIDLFAPFLCYAVAHSLTFFFLRPANYIQNVRMLVMRLFSAFVAVAIASIMFANLQQFFSTGTGEVFAVRMAEERIGNWVGMITVGLLIVTLTQRTMYASRDFNIKSLSLGALPAALMFALVVQPDAFDQAHPLLIAIPPLFLVSFYCGIRVAIFAINCIGFVLLATNNGLNEVWQPGRIEALLCFTGFGSVILGGAADLSRAKHLALHHTARNESERSSRMTDVAVRLTRYEEKERQRIAQELHDQLGQDLTAIATYIQIASKRTSDVGTLEYLNTVSKLVDEAHWHLRDINDKLHPIALSRFGLVRALESGPVIELLTEQGFEYTFDAEDVDRNLPEKIEIAIYRICQEAITNAIKHGKNRWLSITLLQEAAPKGRARLSLQINDDEGEISVGTSTGYGLQGILDRAQSIGATCHFNPERGTPRYALIVEFEPLEA